MNAFLRFAKRATRRSLVTLAPLAARKTSATTLPERRRVNVKRSPPPFGLTFSDLKALVVAHAPSYRHPVPAHRGRPARPPPRSRSSRTVAELVFPPASRTVSLAS